VWLERATLDQIIERVEGRPPSAPGEPRREGADHDHRFVEHRYGERRRTRRKGVLSELFELG
jgi:Zn-finger nucleic acid-binding protein